MKILPLRAILLVAALGSLSGCWRGRLVVCAEPPFWASLGEPLAVRASITWQSLRRGWWPDFLLVGPVENPRGRLSAALAGGRYGAAVVGPMLSFEAAGLAQEFPRTRFILVDGAPQATAGGSSVLLLSDRTAAFQDAGEAARLSLASSGSGGLVGVLAPAGAAAADPEVQAFLRGAGGGGAPAAVVREIATPVDAMKVKAAVAEMRGSGVEIFLARLRRFRRCPPRRPAGRGRLGSGRRLGGIGNASCAGVPVGRGGRAGRDRAVPRRRSAAGWRDAGTRAPRVREGAAAAARAEGEGGLQMTMDNAAAGDRPMADLRRPDWLKKGKPINPDVMARKASIAHLGLHTVCESARCPNLSECFQSGNATFLILGDSCTRDCAFCAIGHGTAAELGHRRRRASIAESHAGHAASATPSSPR